MTEPDRYSSDNSSLGDRIAAAREATDLGRRELAQRIGVRAVTLRRWEEGRAEPRANRVQMLAGVLGVSLRWLLTGEGQGIAAAPAGIEAEVEGIVGEVRNLRAEMAQATDRLSRIERRLIELTEAGA